MEINEQIINQLANDKMQIIYDAVQFMMEKVPFWFTDKLGRQIIVETVEKGQMSLDNGIMEFKINEEISNPIWLKINVDGNYLNGDGWYGWANPPIGVPDGTFHEEILENGTAIEIPNVKIDPLDSIFRLIENIIEQQGG